MAVGAGCAELKVIEFQEAEYDCNEMRCTKPFTKVFDKGDVFNGIPSKVIAFPCGKCLACRINKTREWSKRLQDEALYSPSSAFITLTYDDEHLPRDYNDNPSVSYEDIRHFLARLRKKYKFRYFINSEYGPDTMRPHYHGIIFFDDGGAYNDFLNGATRIVRRSSSGKYIVSYHSPLLEKYWKGGNCEISEVVQARCTYTAKYFINRKEVDDILTPNFSVMSRRPGIGRQFCDEANDTIREYGQHFILNGIGTKVRTPRYYRKVVYTEEEIKEHFEEYLNQHRELIYYDEPDTVEEIRQRNVKFNKKKSKL